MALEVPNKIKVLTMSEREESHARLFGI